MLKNRSLMHHFWFLKEPLKPGFFKETFPWRVLQITYKGVSSETAVLQQVTVLRRTTKPLKEPLRTLTVLRVQSSYCRRHSMHNSRLRPQRVGRRVTIKRRSICRRRFRSWGHRVTTKSLSSTNPSMHLGDSKNRYLHQDKYLKRNPRVCHGAYPSCVFMSYETIHVCLMCSGHSKQLHKNTISRRASIFTSRKLILKEPQEGGRVWTLFILFSNTCVYSLNMKP